jgi:hypothetical protein
MNFDEANVVVAVIALLVSAGLSWTAYRAAVHQNRLSASSVTADWLRDLRAWASEVIDVMAEASYTTRRGDDPTPNPEEAACILRCRQRLSALIDRGRLLLPNEREGEYGSHKPRAYRGWRHPGLDALVAAECVLGGDLALGVFPDKKSALIGLRREFVSVVQGIIDPQSHNIEVARLLRIANETRATDPTLGGLLPDATKVPSGAKGMLKAAGERYKAALAHSSPPG